MLIILFIELNIVMFRNRIYKKRTKNQVYSEEYGMKSKRGKRLQVTGCRGQGAGCKFQVAGCRGQGAECRVQGAGGSVC